MICPTPGCGYRLDRVEDSSAHECPSCAALYLLQPAGIDEDGPHGDRLLRVHDVPPGR